MHVRRYASHNARTQQMTHASKSLTPVTIYSHQNNFTQL